MPITISYASSAREIVAYPEGMTSVEVIQDPSAPPDTLIPGQTDYDLEYSLSTGLITSRHFIVNDVDTTLEDEGKLEIITLDSDLASVDPNNSSRVISLGGEGFVDFVFKFGRKGPIKYRQNMEYQQGLVAYGFLNSYEAGSVSRHIHDTMQPLIAGKTPGVDTTNFCQSISGTWDNPVTTMNPNFFAKEFDWSGISVTRLNKLNDGTPLTMINSRFGFIARHVAGGLTSDHVFKKRDGTYHKSTRQAQENMPNPDAGGFVDLTLVYLTEDVLDIAYYKTCLLYTSPSPRD